MNRISIQIYSKIIFSMMLLSMGSQILLCQKADEKEVEAVYLEKIFGFIDRSASEAGNVNDDQIIIGYFGYGPINYILKDVYSNWTVSDKFVLIKEVKSIGEVSEFDIIFINTTARKELPEIVQKANQNDVLIFSDTEGFAEKGVHFNFYTENSKVHFEINMESIQETNLRVSALLLNYARIVKSESE